jgi:hypothetical protein
MNFEIAIFSLLFIGPPILIYGYLWWVFSMKIKLSLADLIATVLIVGGVYVAFGTQLTNEELPFRIVGPALAAIHLFASTCFLRSALKTNDLLIIFPLGFVTAVIMSIFCIGVSFLLAVKTGLRPD